MRLALAVVASGVATGCKQDKTPIGQSATGSSTATTRPRPSEAPQAQMPPLASADDAATIALGHVLFFDKRLSGAGDRACYSCHQNEHGNGGADPLAIGSGDVKLTRHSPVIWNAGYWDEAFYWDGRAKTLEAQAAGAWGGGNMGAAAGADTPDKTTAALDAKASQLAAIAGYKPLFEAAFPGTPIKGEHVTRALAAYMRTLVCNATAYDRFAAGDKAAFTAPQQRGLDLFLGKGRCSTCHAPPFFSTAMGVKGGAYSTAGIGTQVPEAEVDVGRMKVSNDPNDWAAFKPPSLRNVSRSAPYFHDGSVATLDEAVKLMASGGIANKHKSPLLVDTGLSDAEHADLVAFLGALDCGTSLDEPALP